MAEFQDSKHSDSKHSYEYPISGLLPEELVLPSGRLQDCLNFFERYASLLHKEFIHALFSNINFSFPFSAPFSLQDHIKKYISPESEQFVQHTRFFEQDASKDNSSVRQVGCSAEIQNVFADCEGIGFRIQNNSYGVTELAFVFDKPSLEAEGPEMVQGIISTFREHFAPFRIHEDLVSLSKIQDTLCEVGPKYRFNFATKEYPLIADGAFAEFHSTQVFPCLTETRRMASGRLKCLTLEEPNIAAARLFLKAYGFDVPQTTLEELYECITLNLPASEKILKGISLSEKQHDDSLIRISVSEHLSFEPSDTVFYKGPGPEEEHITERMFSSHAITFNHQQLHCYLLARDFHPDLTEPMLSITADVSGSTYEYNAMEQEAHARRIVNAVKR